MQIFKFMKNMLKLIAYCLIGLCKITIHAEMRKCHGIWIGNPEKCLMSFLRRDLFSFIL